MKPDMPVILAMLWAMNLAGAFAIGYALRRHPTVLVAAVCVVYGSALAIAGMVIEHLMVK